MVYFFFVLGIVLLMSDYAASFKKHEVAFTFFGVGLINSAMIYMLFDKKNYFAGAVIAVSIALLTAVIKSRKFSKYDFWLVSSGVVMIMAGYYLNINF